MRTETVPAKTAVDGRVRDLDALAGRVATVDILPGEQLLAGRFARPGDLAGSRARSTVPEGLQEISVLLEPQRAVGGRLAAGDTVGVVVSLKFEDGTAATHAVLHGVLVTQVQGAPAPVDVGRRAGDGVLRDPAPSASLMITLAVTAAQAEAVVFGIEHGSLWLSLEPDGADTSGTDVITQGNIYGKAFA